MADPRKLDPELSEPERRDLVRNISQRGSDGYEIRDTTVQPSTDYAAAAEATMLADPVVLPEAARAELAGITSAVAEEANRFAEAQRAIFARGQDREMAAGQTYYDQGDMVRDATDFGLARYSESLAAAEEERRRRAAAAAAASRSFFAPPEGAEGAEGGPWQSTSTGFYEVSTALHGPAGEPVVDIGDSDAVMMAAGENVADQVSPEDEGIFRALLSVYTNEMTDASAAAVDYIRMGKTQEQTNALIKQAFLDIGIAEGPARRMSGWITGAYADTGQWTTDYFAGSQGISPDRFLPEQLRGAFGTETPEAPEAPEAPTAPAPRVTPPGSPMSPIPALDPYEPTLESPYPPSYLDVLTPRQPTALTPAQLIEEEQARKELELLQEELARKQAELLARQSAFGETGPEQPTAYETMIEQYGWE